MSDINLEFTVSNNSIEFTVDPIDLTFTPEDIQLQFFTGSSPTPGGTSGELQYNNNGILDGVPNTLYDGSNLTLGNVANIKILGGVNGYVLQTDGTGNLDWTAMSGGGGGNGTPGGSNTQIQYNDSGTFGGNTGFTFNEVSGNVAIPGNLSVVGNIFGNSQTAYLANFATVANSVAAANIIGQVANALVAGTVYTAAQPNITSLGTLTGLGVNGTLTAVNITANTGVFTGNANGVSSIQAGNIVGTTLNSTVVNSSLTSVGTLSNLSVAGNTNLLSTTSLQQTIEKVTLYNSANSGVINYDLLTQAIIYNTANATSNIGINFRANSTITANTLLSTGNSIVATYMLKTGSNAYSIANVSIDGVAQTIRWAGNTVPNSYPSSNISYTFNIVKIANTPTYAVFASSTRYA